MTGEPIIVARGLEKIYGFGRGALRVLKGIDLVIMRGEMVSIVGPSGAGKSTLLNLVGCLDHFQKGSLVLMGRDVSHLTVEDLAGFRNRTLGFIFQQHNLLPEFSALENIMMPLLIRRERWHEARTAALAMLEQFGLSDRAHHKPSELSGGECQRIAVGRAIVGKPDIILADEPTGSLDSVNSRNLTEILLRLGRERGCTIIIVTHDKSIASMMDRTISLVDGSIQTDTRKPE
ncbi:MAG: ABC transporter ATP-binding protein [Spirochaetes bacterium]|nr:ABC transporter ATP-binding protein [Spirochaetota bacterium]